MSNETYRTFGECSNCGDARTYELEKGHAARDTRCVACGCQTLSPRPIVQIGAVAFRDNTT